MLTAAVHRCRLACAASSHHPHLFLSTTTAAAPQFMVKYLVDSPYAFSAADAAKAAQRLAHLKSTAKPHAVLRFLQSQGVDAANVRKLVSWNPKLLCCDVDKTLAPKFHSLLKMGFNSVQIAEMILANSFVFTYSSRTLVPKFELWLKLLGSKERILRSIRNQRFLGYDVEKVILPNLALLHECGIEDDQISMLLRKHPGFIAQSADSIQALIAQVEEFGVLRGSRMFIWALNALYLVSGEYLETKMKLLMSLGWSRDEFFAAFRKSPQFSLVSSEQLQIKMDFLVNEASCEVSYVAENPILLVVSLEKRLIPRFRMINLLKSKGCKIKLTPVSLVVVSEKRFMEKYVQPYVEKFPEISVYVSR